MSDDEIKEILKNTETVAIIGASDDPSRASYDIMRFLIEKGYNVYPVNPNHSSIMGRDCVPDLRGIGERIDLVNVFRNPKYLGPIISDSIDIGARCVWLQMGVVNREAYDTSMEAGLCTVMNRCIKVEYRRLMYT